MNSAITTLQCALADAEANFQKIYKENQGENLLKPPIRGTLDLLTKSILAHRKAIGILSECMHCKKIADNPIWLYDRAICPECADKIKGLNPFGMGNNNGLCESDRKACGV